MESKKSYYKFSERFLIFFIFLSTFSCAYLPFEILESSKRGSSETGYYRWQKLPVSYYISHEFPKNLRGDVHAAFEQWENDLNHDVFEFLGIINVKSNEVENGYHVFKNVIIASEIPGKVDPPRGDGIDRIAHTFVRGLSAIRDTDVVLFQFKERFVEGIQGSNDVYSVKSVMMREIGRMLFGFTAKVDANSVLVKPLQTVGSEYEPVELSQSDIDLFYRTYGDIL